MTDKIGCDFSVSPHPSVAALIGARMGFVGRYADQRPAFDITPPEADSYLDAGFEVILFCEPGAADWLLTAGPAGGERAAQAAALIAASCGMDGIPIYFAADFDAQPGQQGAIEGTLHGCATAIGRHRVGLYGGIGPVSRAFDSGAISYGCQTLAWSHGQWDARANVRQYLSFILDGADCDYDVAMKTDFGQWPRPVAPVGPFRHLADGGDSLLQLAQERNTTVAHLLGLSAAEYTAADLIDLANVVLPKGTPYYTTNQ